MLFLDCLRVVLLLSVFPIEITIDDDAPACKGTVPDPVEEQGDEVDDEETDGDTNVVCSSNWALAPGEERIDPTNKKKSKEKGLRVKTVRKGYIVHVCCSPEKL